MVWTIRGSVWVWGGGGGFAPAGPSSIRQPIQSPPCNGSRLIDNLGSSSYDSTQPLDLVLKIEFPEYHAEVETPIGNLISMPLILLEI